jgi:hypothetical protein
MRTLARALNLARRHLRPEEKRVLIADQLRESPDKSLRWVAKMLGVHHTTVGSVRGEMQSTGEIASCPRTVGEDGKYRPAAKPLKVVARSPVDRKARVEAVTLIHGDCRKELKKLASHSVDAIVTDPIYPEVNRQYGRISENQWLDMMQAVVGESRRILKPKGSAVFIFQPNYEKIGKMRLWLWEFVAWAGREWNLVQDVYWWSPSRSVRWLWHVSLGSLGPRSIEGNRHRPGEEISPDCEEKDHEGVDSGSVSVGQLCRVFIISRFARQLPGKY